MALHIKDEATTAAVRELAGARNLSLTDAVRAACEEALARDRRARPVAERLAAVHARVKSGKPTGQKAGKAFFDEEWSEGK
jgi:antitoxin VapB